LVKEAWPRIAVVGKRRSHQWPTWVAKPIFPAQMRYFDSAPEAEAVEWVAG
jgi:hypothetical protein